MQGTQQYCTVLYGAYDNHLSAGDHWREGLTMGYVISSCTVSVGYGDLGLLCS